MGCCLSLPKNDIHGVLLLDKPIGISSNGVLQKAKYICGVGHAGYVGTLDPMATGMLPVCFGEATKFSQYFSNFDKRYRVIAKLGQQTDTSDSEGKIIKERPILFSKDQLEMTLNKLRGSMLQVPSMFSAIKFHGKKLYEYARKGIKVPREPRLITVYQISLIYYKETEIELEVCCSKGTYIRTLIDDLGENLGCGAHVVYLRRLSINNFPIRKMITLENLKKLKMQYQREGILEFKALRSLLVPIKELFSGLPVINLPLALSIRFKNGSPVCSKNFPIKGIFSVTEGKERKFIGIGEFDSDGRIVPRRLITKGLV